MRYSRRSSILFFGLALSLGANLFHGTEPIRIVKRSNPVSDMPKHLTKKQRKKKHKKLRTQKKSRKINRK